MRRATGAAPRRGIPADLSAVKLALLASRRRAETEDLAVLAAEPLAVVGVGCRFPGGADGPDAFWRLLAGGVDAISAVPPERRDLGAVFDPRRFGPGAGPAPWGGYLTQPVDQFDAEFFGLPAAEAAAIDPQQRLLLEVAWEALEEAGQTRQELAGSRTGVFLGLASHDCVVLGCADPRRLADGALGMARNMAANRLSYLLDLRGPSLEMDTACSSSLVAVHFACQQLRSGECDLALAGGVNLMLVPDLSAAYARLGLLAADGRCKAFDARADGFVRGEGCGVVVLKRLSDALADGDPVRAVVRGSAVNQDGRSNGIVAPNGLAQQEVFRQALESAGVAAGRLGYVEAHGAGTAMGDVIEVEALAAVLGAAAAADEPCVLGSVKTNIGHLEAASGIAGLIKAVLALEREAIPPNLHFRELNPEIARAGMPFRVPRALLPWPRGPRGRFASVHAFGIGGTNAHVVLEEAPALPGPAAGGAAAGPFLLPVSAHTPAALRSLAAAWSSFLRGAGASLPPGDAGYTAALRRSHHRHRLAVAGGSTAELAGLLAAAAREEERPGVFLGAAAESAPAGGAVPESAPASGAIPESAPAGGAPRLDSLAELAAHWVGGGAVDWRRLYPAGGATVRLPGYPWQRVRCWWGDGPPAAGEAPALQLRITARGELDNLELGAAARRPPAAGEVQIRVLAAGLNFRDVLNVLGLYPGDAGEPGSECAGLVAAVGEGVEGCRAGDEVVALLAGGGFATWVNADARTVAIKPPRLSWEEAAALPVVFLTAEEALHRRAALRRGESVLIHAAAGGVGLAAVQLAQLAGAEVFATAGSAEKRRFLASLGVRHALDSRSLDFAGQVLERTAGRGVDVVLNSLAGEVVGRSLDVLAPGGRFVEIGRRDPWDAERVARRRGDVSWQAVDLAAELRDDPAGLGRRLRRLLARFAAGELRPPPLHRFPLRDAVGAFRFMAQARHIGKIVLTPADGADGEAGAALPAPPPAAAADLPARLLAGAPDERQRLLEERLRSLVARLLSLDSPAAVDPSRPLGEMGLGSLGAVELRNAAAALTGRELPATLVFNYPTIRALAAHLAAGPAGVEAEAPSRAASRAHRPPAPAPAPAEPLAVVGIGCRFPGGADGPAALWRLLRDGVDAVTAVPAERWDVEAFYDPDPQAPGKTNSRWGGFLRDVDCFDAPFFGLSPREAEAMDPQQRLLLEVAWEALENAALHPDELAGTATGVFVGLCSNSYLNAHLLQGDLARLDGPFGVGNIASIASGRLSYFFGFQGPSLTLDTACSSSLVAIHLACQSLRQGETDLALAGGVNLVLSPDLSVLSAKLGVMAPDGRCKTFDALADGYSRSEGCGIVVLKRLRAAVAAGDRVLAVVRGTAVNQDGRSSALTAPNGLAQEQVLRRALESAGLAPGDLDYVEAHGSATPLGDAIELQALGAVLGAARSAQRPLAVGSLKTNFGHMEGAAGVAGFIKVVLALAEGWLPANLHLRQPNAAVSFESLHLRVPRAGEPWPAGAAPRRAGVSSFGLSGTNAHAVLEAAPAAAAAGPSRPWQLLLLSAASAAALDAARARLAAHLAEQPDLALADVAHTLRTTRRRFEHRCAVVCSDTADAVSCLSSLPPRRAFVQAESARDRPLVFLFPGVGEHYAGMGAGLYRGEPAFRAALDRCSEALRDDLGSTLGELLYAEEEAAAGRTAEAAAQGPAAAAEGAAGGGGGGADGGGGGGADEELDLRRWLGRAPRPASAAERRLLRTDVAQPVVFAVEIALAAMLMDWGLAPAAMAGYSLGEYVAACLAGVLSLEDALRLVAERARWIQELPAGAMLAVPLPPAEIAPLLAGELSLAAVNGPSLCVVAGPAAAVAELEQRLAERAVIARRLQTSHAFHSRQMEPLCRPLEERLARVALSPPRIPYLSNVTGTWITAAEATDPRYWARHLCQPVRFADALGELLRDPRRAFVEVGPGQSLGAFVRQHPEGAAAASRCVVPTLRHAHERQGDTPFLLASLGKLWLAGAAIDWHGFCRGESRRRVALPPYPFERRHYWLDATLPRPRAAAASTTRLADPADWFSVPAWRQSVLGAAAPAAAAAGPWLAFVDGEGGEGIGPALVERLRAAGHEVLAVRPGTGGGTAGAGGFTLDPRRPAAYRDLLARLGRAPARILHLWSLALGAGADFDEAQERGFYSLLHLVQALGPAAAPLEIVVVASGLHRVTGAEEARPQGATLAGLCRVVPQEHPALACRLLDVEVPAAGSARESLLVDRLAAELAAGGSEPVVAWRGGGRWVQRFERLRLAPPATALPRLRQGGSYLITGGLGGIGLALAEVLARQAGARLTLTARTPLPARREWQRWLAEHGDGEPAGRRIRALQRLEQMGAEVLVAAADAADETAMRGVVAAARRRFGPLHGAFHAAGVVGRRGFVPIRELDREVCEEHFRAKVHGLRVLESVLAPSGAELVVVFSSLSAVLGGAGLAAYAAANACMDAHVEARPAELPATWISVDWDTWRLPGSVTDLAAAGGTLGDLHMSPEEGIAALLLLLGNPVVPRAVHSLGDLEARLERWVGRRAAAAASGPGPAPAGAAAVLHARPAELATAYAAPRSDAERLVTEIWREVLGLDRVGVHDGFFELGGHSLLALQILARLRQTHGVDVQLGSLLEAATPAALAALVEALAWNGGSGEAAAVAGQAVLEGSL
jgi:phthiocerol/phenolphthiocerol synthesis type-I polyketide synthase E